jgi:hypothetical protein
LPFLSYLWVGSRKTLEVDDKIREEKEALGAYN